MDIATINLDNFIYSLKNPYKSKNSFFKPEMSQKDIIAQCPSEYQYFITHSNGGYTKYLKIHFYGCSAEIGHNIFHVNDPDIWKKYFGLSWSDFCFAESIFGDQFFFQLNGNDNSIYRLYLETGEVVKEYDNFNNFLFFECIEISDYEPDVLQIQEIQENLGQIPSLPIHVGCVHPVQLSGNEVDSSNYEYVDPITHLIFSGQLYRQLNNLSLGIIFSDVSITTDARQNKQY